MAELMQLDKAAALAGKSEVTLRRLIKAGKIPFEKEKTLTGFIYKVNPDHVRSYYQAREGAIFDLDNPAYVATEAVKEKEIPAPPAQTQPPMEEMPIERPVRVAVASESGTAEDYWQKRSERYEERYYDEVARHAQTREELGVWHGRAEQAQTLLLKLLPSSQQEVEVHHSTPTAVQEKKRDELSAGMTILITALIILLLVAVGLIVYLKLR